MSLEKWPKWIHASICDHFGDNLDSTMNLLYPGQQLDDETETPRTELRIDGPNLTENTAGQWIGFVTINTYIVRSITNNIYILQESIGKILEIFGDIQVYSYGDGDNQIGCLQLNSNIKVSYTGQPQPNVKIQRAFIEATYKIMFSI